MAPMQEITQAATAILQRQEPSNAIRQDLPENFIRQEPGNAIIAATIFGLGAFLIIVALIALRCILPCAIAKRETLAARAEARRVYRNRKAARNAVVVEEEEVAIELDSDYDSEGEDGKSAKAGTSAQKSGVTGTSATSSSSSDTGKHAKGKSGGGGTVTSATSSSE